MVGESNKNVFLIQLDASKFAEFEISKFEIAGVDCIQFRISGRNTMLFQLINSLNQGPK